MNPVLKLVALFVRDLLSYDEQLIRIGRQNFEREEFETAYIVVDALGQTQAVARIEVYDGDAEAMAYGSVWRGSVTLDFYGPGAYNRAREFCLLARSQAAYELKTALGVVVYDPHGLTDVKALTGQQYGERVQVEMVVEHSADVVVDTLRIDTAQFEIRSERGIEYDG